MIDDADVSETSAPRRSTSCQSATPLDSCYCGMFSFRTYAETVSGRCIAKRCVAALQGREASRSDRSKTTVRSASAQTRRQSSPTSIMPVRSQKRTGAGLAMTWPRPPATSAVDATSAPGLGSPLPHLRRNSAHSCGSQRAVSTRAGAAAEERGEHKRQLDVYMPPAHRVSLSALLR